MQQDLSAQQDEAISNLSSQNENTLQAAHGMLERGEITVEQYRALTGRDGAWILKEKANKAAPAAPAQAPAAPAPAPAAPTRQMGPTTADLYPNGMPGDTPSMSERFGNTAVGQAVGSTGSFLGNTFDTLDNAKLAVDRAIGNTVGPVVEGIGSGIGNAASWLYDLIGQGADSAAAGIDSGLNAIDSGVSAGLGAVGSAFETADNFKLAQDRKVGQALQGLLDELSSGRITMEQYNKLREALLKQEYRSPRAPN
jgi:hypothetical protein